MKRRSVIHTSRNVALVALAVAPALTLGCGPQAPEGPAITAVSWGGSYGRAYRGGIQVPFTEETGIRVDMEDYNGGLAQIRAQVDVGAVHWDVVDLEMADAMRGCDEGLLEPIDIDMLPPAPDGTSARDDFYLEMQGPCGAGMLFYSTVYAYNADLFPDEKPATMADFFDLERFPGRRGMRRVPQVNLEFALIADGVPLDEVYAVLRTPEGLDRAFEKLDTISDQVIWWEAGAQPPQMLADGEVVMSTAYNGRIFNAQVLEEQPFTIVWDGQLLDYGQLSIVAGTPRLEDALRFLRFATTGESLAAVARRISYGPARRSGEPLVTTHLATGVEMAPHMPTSPENAAHALRNDWEFWVDNQDALNERFSAWLTRAN